MSEYRSCPTCGHKTTRDFCTPDCRMQDSDARIEGVEEERDKYRKALEELQVIIDECYCPIHLDILIDTIKEALNRTQ